MNDREPEVDRRRHRLRCSPHHARAACASRLRLRPARYASSSAVAVEPHPPATLLAHQLRGVLEAGRAARTSPSGCCRPPRGRGELARAQRLVDGGLVIARRSGATTRRSMFVDQRERIEIARRSCAAVSASSKRPHGREVQRVDRVGDRQLGVQRDRLLQLAPASAQFHSANSRPSASVTCASASSRSSSSARSAAARARAKPSPRIDVAVVRHRAVGVAEARHRPARTTGSRSIASLEVFERPPEPFRRPAVPVVASAQVRLIGLRIDRRSLPQLLLLRRRQLESQRFGNLPGDLFLHRQQVVDLRGGTVRPRAATPWPVSTSSA